MKTLLLTALALASGATPPAEPGWPQWRGPARDGISTETGWSPEGRELWRAEVGRGYSTVSVVEGRLYTAGHDDAGGRDVISCLDAASGEELWSTSFPAERMAKFHGGGTLTTPSVRGDAVYTLNREGKLHCLDAATGAVRWERDYREELGLELPTWGFAASPLVLEDALLVNLGSVLSLDEDSGDVLWRSADYGDAYSTPVDLLLGDVPALALFNGRGLALIDRRDGKELWLHEWKTQYDVNAATPVVVGDDRLFISSGYGHGCAMLRATPTGGEVLWESKAMRTKMAGCVAYEGSLYGFDEGQFKCLGLDGEERWRERSLGDGAFLLAGGRLVLVSSEGELVVAEASPEGFRELSREKVLDGGVYWTTPVLVEGRIYVRNSLGSLVCRDHRGSPVPAGGGSGEGAGSD